MPKLRHPLFGTASDPESENCYCTGIDASQHTPRKERYLDSADEPYSSRINPNLRNDRLTNRLPVEIVSRIFIVFDQINEPGPGINKMSSFRRSHWDHLLRTPAILSRVCRKWRDIASATPQLWTNLLIDIGPWWGCSCRRKFFEQVLSRSGSLPLSLVLHGNLLVHGDDSHIRSCKVPLYTLTDLIRLHSERWCSLDIECLDDTMTHQLFHNLDRNPTTDLLALKIRYPILDAISLPNPLRPRRFYATVMRPITGWGLPMEWDNLTHLEVHLTDTEVLVAFLQKTPRLTHLLSREGVWFNPIYLPESPIVISTLEHVELNFQQHSTGFFRCLTLPALKHLECSFGVNTEAFEEMSFDDLIDFVDRSHLDSNSLTTFKVFYHVSGTDYDRNFIQLTALTELSVDIAHTDTMAIDSYLSSISGPSVLPCLRALRLQRHGMAHSSWTLLCNVIHERLLPTNRSLECVSVSVSRFGTMMH